MFNKVVVAYFKAPYRHFLAMTEENTKSLFSIASLRADI
jgi:hypothetical protein